jgi:Ser/Thr protein kinase RdoA (MazF antagonist)
MSVEDDRSGPFKKFDSDPDSDPNLSVIGDAPWLTPAWLTEQMGKRGILTVGEVATVEERPLPLNSGAAQFCCLDIGYTGGGADGPRQCLMKVGRPERESWNLRELAFYDVVGDGPHHSSVVDCYGAHHDASSRRTFLLLEDHGGSRHMTQYPVPPDLSACERAVDTLASFHAAWWENPLFADSRFDPWSEERARSINEQVFRPAAEDFLVQISDRLSARRRALLSRYADRFASILGPRFGDGGLTLVHEDAHLWNFLIPDDPNAQVHIVDWQMWDVDLPVWDLVYMVALHWFPERRARYERPLLDRYLHGLQSAGIDFSRQRLMEDYRLMVLRSLCVPILGHAWGIPADIWWNHLERSYLAIEDWDAEELLG